MSWIYFSFGGGGNFGFLGPGIESAGLSRELRRMGGAKFSAKLKVFEFDGSKVR